MARRKPAETGPYGELDGRTFDGVELKVNANKRWARLPAEGERMLLMVEGRAHFASVKVGEEFVRVHTFTVDAIGEAEDDIATAIEDTLREIADLQGGRQRLPLDGDEGEGEADGADGEDR